MVRHALEPSGCKGMSCLKIEPRFIIALAGEASITITVEGDHAEI
eukprot:CAMPEP_0115859244 /NCGR_PEP_ID=MMETSP0287-20121206/16516_1 /TAXON_ID=412157 /ORGANISM="Chrysochromulina rotalis, Strain UIO044" /LENGTH=44 /DNA_ID= /DNA_START= /DNA_END= /DNA_ORIENTATION=